MPVTPEPPAPSPGDVYDEMSRFRSVFGALPSKSTGPEYYRWKLRDNPFGAGYYHFAQRDGRRAGLVTLTPRRAAVFGRVCTVGQLGDGYTHPDFRRQGIFSQAETDCIDHALANEMGFVYGDTTAEALRAEERIGMRLCPFSHVRVLVKVVDLDRVQQSLQRRVHLAPLSRRLASLYLRWSNRHRSSQASGGAEVVAGDPDDLTGNGLWGRPRDDYVFFMVRDGTYLSWRYFSNPDPYEVLAAQSDGACVGYVVTKIYSKDGAHIGLICDFAAEQDDTDTFSRLIAAAEAGLLSAGAQYIHVMCSKTSPYYKGLRRLGYWDRGGLKVIAFSGSDVGRRAIDTKAKWHFTFGDSDNV